MTGWALDDVGVSRVDIYRSPVAGESGLMFVGRAVFIRGARPDVQALFPNAADNDNAGLGLHGPDELAAEPGQRHVRPPRVRDRLALGCRRCSARAGSWRPTSTSIKPFGTIDTPGQGETVSGTIVNFGWALTPVAKSIPVNGSTIDVYVDGVFRGHPVYNNYRADIAGLFPGLSNTNGAVGYFMLNTTTLSNGLHTIQWTVTDSAGQVAGIGSRFFRVQN